jgi:hypothetical protein
VTYEPFGEAELHTTRNVTTSLHTVDSPTSRHERVALRIEAPWLGLHVGQLTPAAVTTHPIDGPCAGPDGPADQTHPLRTPNAEKLQVAAVIVQPPVGACNWIFWSLNDRADGQDVQMSGHPVGGWMHGFGVQSVPSPWYTPPCETHVAPFGRTVQVPFEKQQAPGSGGGWHVPGPHAVPSPWYTPPMPVQALEPCVVTHEPPGRQQAPLGCEQLFGVQSVPGPCGVPPAAWHSDSVTKVHEPLGKQQACGPGGWGH